MSNQKLEESESSKLKLLEKNKPSFKLKMVALGLLIGLGIFIVYDQYQTYNSNFKPSQSSFKKVKKQPADLLKQGPKIGSLAPNFTSKDAFGRKVALSDFYGKKSVLLVFWATWCNYCAKELSDLKTFTNKHQAQIQVIAVDSGETKETIKKYIKEKEINFTILLDEQRKIWNTYSVRGTPSHFLINKKGKIVTLIFGLASLNDLEIMLTML